MRRFSSFLLLCAAMLLYAAGAAAARPPELDLWVSGGYCRAWQSADLNGDAAVGREDFLLKFPTEAQFRGGAEPVSPASPIRLGRGKYRGVYVTDGTPLFFEDGGVLSGDIVGFSDLYIEGGAILAGDVLSDGALRFGSGCALEAAGNVSAGAALSARGGQIAVRGGIHAPAVWLSAEDAPLALAVAGDIVCGFYTQMGGCVTVGGGIASIRTVPDGRGPDVLVGCDGAGGAPTVLRVAGDMTAGGTAALGFRFGDGGMDEAEGYAFLLRRGGALPLSPGGEPLFITVGGGLNAGEVEIYAGEVEIAGTLTATGGSVAVRGGQVSAGGLRAAKNLILGSAGDDYGTNREIAVTLGGKAEYGGVWIHHAGTLIAGR